MRRLLRLLVVLGAIAGVATVVAFVARRRAAAPETPTYTFDETDEAGA